jgi:signal transduction histidine kinase
MVLASLPLRVNGHQLATVIAGTSTPQLQRLRRAVLIGSIVGALAILLVGALLIHRALAAALEPVERMTRDAEEWGDHDLDRRFNLGPPRDEISSLAMTLDHLLARISASRRHEQRFAAEVAHELRTPLAALRGTAELAQRAPSLDQARDALARIEAQSLRLSEQLDALMAQIRREPQGENHTVLKDVVAEFAEIRTITSGDPDAVVEGEPALVRQMLAPLIENARRHASESVTVEIRGEPDQVSVIVRDDGPGVEPGLGGRVFLPGIRGTQAEGDGAGLGLPLALRLAASFGGQITLGDGPGGCFILSLPRVPHSG